MKNWHTFFRNSTTMKRIVLLVFLLTGAVMLQAQNDTVHPRLKVGVVFGGGGAKGASHIGVLKYMEEIGIPVDYVAGTSMGAIIGGLYAMGYTPDELNRLIANINWSEYIGNTIDRPLMSEEARQRNSTLLFQIPFSHESLVNPDPDASFISQLPSAYVNNASLVNLFNDLCVGYQEEMDFNDLPIPFACVATDLISGDEIVLRSGSAPTAMRASMAIPGVFSPVTIGDQVLVDGGLVNNFPADILREMGADVIIGIEIVSTKDITADNLQSLPQVLSRLVTNSTSAKRAENREMCDVYIVPDITGYGMLSFTPEAIDTLVNRGYKKASEYREQLQAVKDAIDASAGQSVSKTLSAQRAKNLASEPVLIQSININNVNNRENRWLIRKGRLKLGKRYDEYDIERAMKIYRGTGCFDEITYQLKRIDSINPSKTPSDAYTLKINMKPAKPHVMGLGVRYDTEDGAALLFHLGLNEKKFGGVKFNSNIKMSYSPKVNLTLTYAAPSLANFSAAYDYRNQHFTMLIEDNKKMNLHYLQHKVSGYISQFHLLNLTTKVGLSYTHTQFDLSSVTGDSPWDTIMFVPNTLITPFVDMGYDNLDDAYFAKHGIKANITGRYHMDKQYEFTQNYLDIAYRFQSYITPGNGRFTIIPQVYGQITTGLPDYFNLFVFCGGDYPGCHFESQMPFVGISSVEYLDTEACVLRCDLRYSLFKKHYLTAMYNCVATWTLWKLTGDFNDIFSHNAHGAGLKYSYDSPVGPISLTTHWARLYEQNHFGAYFSFGYTF